MIIEPGPIDSAAPFRWWRTSIQLLLAAPGTAARAFIASVLLQSILAEAERGPAIIIAAALGTWAPLLMMRWLAVVDCLLHMNAPIRHSSGRGRLPDRLHQSLFKTGALEHLYIAEAAYV